METISYHYTNIDVLALILKNRTLRFTRLDQMDDPEECNFVSNGVNLGQYTFVSCWTEVKEESIPMWKMYTKDKWGIRISLEKEGLFRTYTDHEYISQNNVVTEVGKEVRFLLDPKLRFNQTEYLPPFLTDDYDKCHFYRKIQYVDDITTYADNCVQIPDDENSDAITLITDKVGSYKHKRWAFQEESRFVMFFMPGNSFPYHHDSEKFISAQRQIIRDVKRNKELKFSYYDMNLSDGAFEHLVITMSPFCDDAQWAIVEALRDKYAPKAEIRGSNLAGKLAK